MNKTKAIVQFCLIGVLVIGGLLLCFVNVNVPFTNKTFDGFYTTIKNKMGIDLNGGVLAVYDVVSDDSKNLERDVEATKNRIAGLLADKGYLEANVVKAGSYLDGFKIRIEVPGMDNTDEIVSAIGTPAKIEFMKPTASQLTQDSEYDESQIFMTGEDISGVGVVSDPNDMSSYAIQLNFTPSGRDKFRAEMAVDANSDGTPDAGGKYISIFSVTTNPETGAKVQTLESSASIPADKVATLGAESTVLITGEYDKEDADKFALQIESGLYDVQLQVSETSTIPATLGEDAILAGIIALVLGLILIFIIMWYFYRDLGMLSNLSMLIYTIIFLFFLAVIDAVQLTLPGIAGIILSIGMAVDANVLIFEQIKEEYRAGKRFGSAVHSGFNKSVRTILDANITTIIASVVLYIFSEGAIKGFAITLFLGVAISMFTGLVITRGLAKLYLYINPDNAARARIREVTAEEKAQAENPAPAIKAKRKLNMGADK